MDRTVLTLSTGDNEQDVRVMLGIYSDMAETPEPQTDNNNTQKKYHKLEAIRKNPKITKAAQEYLLLPSNAV